MDFLIRVEIGPEMLLIINLIRIELILSSLQLFFGFSYFIISKISLESVGLKKSVLLFCFLFHFIWCSNVLVDFGIFSAYFWPTSVKNSQNVLDICPGSVTILFSDTKVCRTLVLSLQYIILILLE